MWHYEDWALIKAHKLAFSKKKKLLSQRFIISCGDKIVWKAVTVAYLWIFYAICKIPFAPNLLPDDTANAKTRYKWANFVFIGTRENVFMVIALPSSKKPRLKWTQT
jgi:hypothetical protein